MFLNCFAFVFFLMLAIVMTIDMLLKDSANKTDESNQSLKAALAYWLATAVFLYFLLLGVVQEIKV